MNGNDILLDSNILAKKLKLPDAIIASTAITSGIPLATSDDGFKNIKGLNVIFYNLPVKE